MARARTPERRRRRAAVVVGFLLLVGLVVTSAATATELRGRDAIESVQAEGLQNDTPENDTSEDDTPENDSVGEPAGGQSQRPAETTAENESSARSPADDTPRIPPAESQAGAQLVQQPGGNVTASVAENQSVRADEATTIALEVTNDGDRQATDIVVTVQTVDGAVTLGPPATPQSSQSVVVEDLWPGDTAIVDVGVVAANVDPETYPLFASVQYRVDPDSPIDEPPLTESAETNETVDDDENGTVRTGGPTLLELPISNARSFEVTPVDDEIPVDGDAVYEARITNEGDTAVTEVVATIEAGPPLSSESPTAYVGTLESGESATARFALESSSDSIESTTSIAITLTYDTGTGDRTSTDPMPVPVSIVQTDEDTDVDALAPFAAVAIVFVLTVIWWIRRR
ncbi:COG1361 S-layer family protein [Halopiger aswanensis]|uniref:Uncharacterized protein n=1 Tax=Halopiger aswanensis TaxID=148449 RepID=A0A3R7FTD4_9EURY|nr:hypothetical protein [Halopiger aswanensis]RKD88990.1 hypothetical protein ATJ93_3811 [Halopiger aswanensis]